MRNSDWSKEEDDLIRKYYPTEGSSMIKRLPNRTVSKLYYRANTLGVYVRKDYKNYNTNSWTDAELNILEEHYANMGNKILDLLPNRTLRSVYSMAYKLGYTNCQPNKLVIPDRVRKNKNTSWTDEELAILSKYYPIEGIKVMYRLNNRTKLSCFSMANKLGLKYRYTEWTNEELSILKEYYPIEGIKVINRLPKHTVNEITYKCRKLNIHVQTISTHRRKKNTFSNEEVAILKEYYPKEGLNVIKRLPNKTRNDIVNKVRYMGLSYSETSWTDSEISMLCKYYKIEGDKAFNRFPNKSYKECKEVVIKNNMIRNGRWTTKEINILKKYYPTEGRAVANRLPGRTFNSVNKKANFLNIRYSRYNGNSK